MAHEGVAETEGEVRDSWGRRRGRAGRRSVFGRWLALSLCLVALAGRPPAAWASGGVTLQGADLGTPGAAGSESCTNDVWTVTGAGTGVFGAFSSTSAGDPGHFSYLSTTGDIEIVARVTSFTGGPKSQVGLMLRETTDDHANMASVVVEKWLQPTDNPIFVSGSRRPSFPANPSMYDIWNATQPPMSLPYWLKLVRIGGNFTAYRSSDGVRWCPIHDYGGGAFTTTGSYLAGLFVSGGANGVTATATLDSLYIGAPRLEYRTSWVGNSFSSDAERFVSANIAALWVGADGRCYTNTFYDEAGEAAKIYSADGHVIRSFTENGYFGNNSVGEGSVTGDGPYIYILGNRDNQNQRDRPYRTDLDGNNITPITFTSSIGRIGGMAAGNGRIFFSDVDHDRVLVVSAATLTEISSESFSFMRPGPMAIDSRGDLWIIRRATDYPSSFIPVYSDPAVRCYSFVSGQGWGFSGREITGIGNPSALCVDPNQDRLLVCENGPDQNIRIYTDLTQAAPTLSGSFGTPGGVFAGGVRGLLNDLGSGGYTRLYGPNGVGIDAAGNLYVSCAGVGTHLRKFAPNGSQGWSSLVWSLSGLPFTHCPDFDPTTDGQDLYYVNAHFSLDYTHTAPGSEWSYTGVSWNPRGPDPQGRGDGGAVFRRFGPNNQRFMFSVPGTAGLVRIYRYDGELAIPCGRVDNGLWIDQNGDGLETPDEDIPPISSPGAPLSFDVDASGNLYVLRSFDYDYAAGQGIIRRYHLLGVNALGVPLYGLQSGEFDDQPIPYEIAYPHRFRYDAANDAMTVLGTDASASRVPRLARWEHWSQPTRALRFLKTLPTPETDPNFLYFPPYPYGVPFEYFAMDAVGGMIFAGELWGPIHVYDAALGNEVTRLIPGAEVSGVEGWTDIFAGIRAFQRANGEYVVVREDAGYRSRNLMFRWTPQTPTVAPAAPTNLAAEGGSDRIRLTWDGGAGLTRKYTVWRGSTSGAETLLADNLTVPQYDDTSVQFGVSYYYRVTGSNEAGSSGFSNEVVASANTAASFARVDTTTRGNWRDVYGTQGYTVVNDTSSYLPGIQVTPTGATPFVLPEIYTWATAPTDPNALQKASGSGRIGSIWHQGNVARKVQVELNLTDGQPHQVALYVYDWQQYPDSSLRVDISDDLGRLLDSRTISPADIGKYVIWTLSGHLHLVFYPGSPPIEVSGLFIDPPTTAPAAPTGLTAAPASGQVQLSWTGSVGATSYRVYRSTTQGGPYQWLASGISSTSYQDSTAAPGTTYYYVVTAANAGGESGYSGEASAAVPQASVTINPGSFTGRYVLIFGNNRTTYTGQQVLPLAPGNYSIDDGASVGGSAFSFDVNNAGQVLNVSNPAAATANGSTLTFNNASVVIQPGAYAGRYRFGFSTGNFVGTQTIVFIPGLVYFLDNGSGIGGSGFSFTVADSSGMVTQISNSAAASASGNTLTFNTTSLTVDPRGYTGQYSLASYFINGQKYQGVHTFALIANLVYALDDTGAPNGSSFNFTINGTGVITSISNPASASGVGGTTLYLSSTPPPSAPTITSAHGGDNSADFDWDPVATASSYNVYRGTQSGGPYTRIATGVTATTYHDTGVTNGNTYYYVVTAVNGSDESAYSNEVSVLVQPPPGAVTNLTATPGNAQVSLSWTAAPRANYYLLYRLVGPNDGGTVIASVFGTSYTDVGVTNGTTYGYFLAPVNGSGQGPYTDKVYATPAAPASVTAVPASVTLPDTAVGYSVHEDSIHINNNGSTTVWLLDYTITTSGDENDFEGRGLGCSAQIRSDGIVARPIAPGQDRFAAIDFAPKSLGNKSLQVTIGYDQGPYSPIQHVTFSYSGNGVAPPIPDAPQELRATAGDGQVRLRWEAAAGAASYTVKRSTISGGGPGGYQTVASGVTSIDYTDTGLTNGTTYYYVVSAVNLSGEGPDSSEASATPQPPPGPVTNLMATPGNAQVSLSWTAAARAAIYLIFRAEGPNGVAGFINTTTDTTYTDAGLTNGTTYSYYVVPENSSGDGPASDTVSAMPMAPPSAPTNLQATPGNGQVTLSWTASATASSYTVYRGTTSGGPYALVASGVTGTTYIDTGMTNGTTYYYVVTASNAGGESPQSNQASATPVAPPAAPANLQATAGNAQVTLTWNAVSGATSYAVKRATTSGGPYQSIASGLTTPGYTNTGLTNGTTYYYVVTASNTGGESGNSNQASATPMAPPAAPQNLTAMPGNGQVTLTWSAVSGAASYTVKRSTTSGGPYQSVASGVTATIYTNTGLTNGTTYYYVVSASNAGGEGPNSSQVSATPQKQLSAPAPPTNLQATAGNAQVSLTWTASSGASSYNVKRASASGGPYQAIASVKSGTSYTNTGLTNGTTYYYLVTAVSSAGESGNSIEASATPQGPPPAPSNLVATVVSGTQINLTWTNNSTNQDSLEIERATGTGKNLTWTVITVPALPGTTSSYSDAGLTRNTTYNYRVRAHNSAGYSPYSSTVKATTLK